MTSTLPQLAPFEADPMRPEDLAACRAALVVGSKSFATAARILPRRVRAPATALYAFCRVADDAVDTEADPKASVRRLRERLDAIYINKPINHPADRAFAAVVAEYEMPKELPGALIEGFEWDAEERRYDTLDALHAYCARVAGTVGAMMALLMGVRDGPRLARACDLGVAMQLTNIARDIGEDARNGRIYLPLDWMREAGIDPEAWQRNPSSTPALREITHRMLANADMLYARSEAGIAALPSDCRSSIRAAGRIYAEIGRMVRSEGFDPVTKRAIVPKGRKLALLANAMLPRLARSATLAEPPLDATAYLVRAVPNPIGGDSLSERIEWLIGVINRVEGRAA
jgi:phytoene synthase